MNKIKKLTNAYLLQLAQTDIDSRSYTKIVTALQDVDIYTSDSTCLSKEDRIKDLLIDKLCSIPGVDKVTIFDESSFQFGTLGLQANGAGPITVLIIGEGK